MTAFGLGFDLDLLPLLIACLLGAAVAIALLSRTTTAAKAAEVPFVCGPVPGSKAVGGQVRFEQQRLPSGQIAARASTFYKLMNTRRSLRFISPDLFPISALEDAIRAAGTAPSGAHGQPWHFCLVTAKAMKAKIREAVETEEKVNWEKRMSQAWKKDLEHIMPTKQQENWQKPYLTEAPCLIVCMKMKYLLDTEGKRSELRYPEESMGIACGLLIAALHNAGLMTLTSTPMNAEKKIKAVLDRPENEKVYLLMPVGFAGSNATVPHRPQLRKPDIELMTRYA